VKSSVGSLRGTSGEDGTIAWPFLAKYSRNVVRMSLAVCMGQGFIARPPGCPGRAGTAAVKHTWRPELDLSGPPPHCWEGLTAWPCRSTRGTQMDTDKKG